MAKGSGPTHSSPQGAPSAEDQGTADINELAQHFGELARTLEAEDDVDDVLEQVVVAAIELIPGADEGSISVVVGRRQVTSQHPSSDLPRRVDAIQTETNEGPCLSAVYDEHTVRVPDMAAEERWPEFASRAAEAGAASMLSFQLYVKDGNLGALNLYGRTPNAFTDESEQVGLLFASHASVAFADAQKLDQLQRAVVSRDLIGQAKGILMERFQIDADRAFVALTRMSQQSHRPLREVAEQLARTRQIEIIP